MYVTTCGRSLIVPNGGPYPRVEHPPLYDFDWAHGRVLQEYQCVYIEEGSGILETKEQRFKVEGGHVMLLRPGVWHRYRPNVETGWREFWVGFAGDGFEAMLNGPFFADRILFRVRATMRILTHFETLVSLAQDNGPALQQTMAAQTGLLLAFLYSTTLPRQSSAKCISMMLEKARDMMLDPKTRDISLEETARNLGTSYSSFRRTFREQMGVSPHQYRLHLKVSQAKELLLSTNSSIKEIAFHCGFSEEQYFCRLFRKATGRTASSFRSRQ